MGGGNPPTSLADSILSTISVSLILLFSGWPSPSPTPHRLIRLTCPQTEDMVEIKRQAAEDLPTSHEDPDGSKYRLLYTKSKVYVNPTAYARDNIPGFVAIVKRVRHRPQLGEPIRVLMIPFVPTGGSKPYLSPRVDTRKPIG